MTREFDLLMEEPQTNFDRGKLRPDERSLLYDIRITAGKSAGNTNVDSADFKVIYYLEGDEDRAAKKFVDLHEDLLRKIDFSKRNVISQNVSREIYDYILHFLGERVITPHPTVIVEERPDGGRWIVPREVYEDLPMRRYTQRNSAYVPPEVSLEDVYTEAGSTISVDDLENAGIEGNLVQVLNYYCDADFDCRPLPSKASEAAIEKVTE